jgi:hypothetical protein
MFEYHLKTHVGFAVIDTIMYLPLILFKKLCYADKLSRYFKNMICQCKMVT